MTNLLTLVTILVTLVSCTILPGHSAAQLDTCALADAASLDFLNSEEIPSVILDTDFAGDVDDVGALAVLHALADAGEAEILGVTISSGNRYAARAVDTINTYYGRPDIPIGATWDPAVSPDSAYTLELALDFPNDIDIVPDAVALYRQLLSEQPDHSVTIVSVGFLTNLHNLLASEPDALSALNGSELVAAKVAKLVAMGGHFPTSELHPDGREYNFALDTEAAYTVIPQWPTPIIFSGFEIGVDIETGALLEAKTPEDNPVRVAYNLFNGGTGRSSWDLTAVHVAVRGLADVWQLCGPGYVSVYPEGRNDWESAQRQYAHYYMVNQASKAQIEALLDSLLIEPAQES